MSTNCIRCVVNKRTGPDLLCDGCRRKPEQTMTTHCTCITVPFSTVGRITIAPSRTCPLHGTRDQVAKLTPRLTADGVPVRIGMKLYFCRNLPTLVAVSTERAQLPDGGHQYETSACYSSESAMEESYGARRWFQPTGSLDQESGHPCDVSLDEGRRIEGMSGEQLRRAGLAK